MASETTDRSEHWAKPVRELELADAPEGAINLNVAGRRVTSPIQGFGKMWQKTFVARLPGDVVPEDVIRVWKERFGEFWPGRSKFYGSLAGIKAGDVALINMSMGPMRVSTGVLVMYADDTSFTVMTPQGHMFAGFNTFSAERDGDETVVQIQALIRASDPIFEAMNAFGGNYYEEKFWIGTLQAVGRHFGHDVTVEKRRVCVDKRRQWRQWRNVWHNAAIRTALYLLGAPARWFVKPFRKTPTLPG